MENMSQIVSMHLVCVLLILCTIVYYCLCSSSSQPKTRSAVDLNSEETLPSWVWHALLQLKQTPSIYLICPSVHLSNCLLQHYTIPNTSAWYCCFRGDRLLHMSVISIYLQSLTPTTWSPRLGRYSPCIGHSKRVENNKISSVTKLAFISFWPVM